jgi:hypothetical protein
MKVKDIFDLVYESLLYNLFIREEFYFYNGEKTKKYKKEEIKKMLDIRYKFFSKEDKKNIIDRMINDYNLAKDVFFSKDSEPFKKGNSRLERLIRLFLDNPIIDELDKAIFNAMYIVSYQIFSDGNHRTAYFLMVEYLKKFGIDIHKKLEKEYIKLNKNLQIMNKYHQNRDYKIPLQKLYGMVQPTIFEIKKKFELSEKPVISYSKKSDYLQKQKQDIQISTPTFQSYLKQMLKTQTYGGEPEIIAFCRIYKYNVGIINVNRGNINVFMTDRQPAKTIFLLYNEIIKHYDVAWIDD